MQVGISCTTYSGQIASTGQIIPTFSQTCPKRPFKNSQNKGLNDNGSLMKVLQKVLQNAPLEHSAILFTCIKR